MMKILHSADWHLDTPFTGRDPAAGAYLRRMLLSVPGRIAELCAAEQCDMVLLAGDLFDGTYSRESYRVLYAALEAMKVPVFISPGNHDPIGADSPWEREIWPENVYIFTKEQIQSVSVAGLDCRVYGAGYQSMDCPGLLAGFRAEGSERYHIGLLHSDPTQAETPYCPVTREQIRASGLHYLALGHVHKGGSFPAGDTLCGWPGCPMGRGYDETGEKGVYLVEVEEGATARFLPLKTPRFFDLQSTADRWQQLLPPAGSHDFFRITLTGYRSRPLAAIPPGYPHLELRDQTLPEAELWGAAGEDTLEGVYFGMLRAALEDKDEQTRSQILLAARISRQILDGQEVVLP